MKSNLCRNGLSSMKRYDVNTSEQHSFKYISNQAPRHIHKASFERFIIALEKKKLNNLAFLCRLFDLAFQSLHISLAICQGQKRSLSDQIENKSSRICFLNVTLLKKWLKRRSYLLLSFLDAEKNRRHQTRAKSCGLF